ncbi:MAG TPA: prolipoprotein diacylglyceryl transferase [Candidatus Binatia bacterium]|nr:prolipoprotein diacylglyceryl transferase [Candidatus Binatia bacterium]
MVPVLFRIGPLTVSSFWACALLAFVAGWLLIRRDLGAALATDAVLVAYVGGWVGARLFLVPGEWTAFASDPVAFLVASAGWAWYGGVIGGAAAVAWLARARRIPFLVVGDAMAPALALGLAIGRLGCQLSGDGDYGVPTSLPWGMRYPDGLVPTSERVHPAPLYELAGSLAILAYLESRRPRKRAAGDLLGRYLVLAGALRLAVETVRRNPAWLAGLTTAQWLSFGAIAIGAGLVQAAGASCVAPAPSARSTRPD